MTHVRRGRGFLCAVVIFCCAIFVTECQLDFQVEQTFHGINLLCAVGDLRSSSFSKLDSLHIFKSVAGKRQVLASLSSHYGHNDPVSHLDDAQVTGQLSNEDFDGYLRITWNHSQADLDGDYICDLNGVDEDFVPLTLTQTLSVQVKTMCPCFGTSPEFLRVGLTSELEAICYIPDPAAINISKLASLEIIIVRNEVMQILAAINSLTGIPVYEGPGDGFVNGSLEGRNTFLRAVMEYPTSEMATEYICEGSGVGVDGKPVFFSKHVNVSLEVPDSEELIRRLFEIYDVQKELKRCQEERDRLTNTPPGTTIETTTIPMITTKSISLVTNTSLGTTLETTKIPMTTTTSISQVTNKPLGTTLGTTTFPIPMTTTTSISQVTNTSLGTTLETTTFPIPKTTTTTTTSIFPRSCEEASLPVGQFAIFVQPNDGLGAIAVLCEITPRETWTVFQKRFDGSVSFYRGFNEYRNGFGNVNGEFWLGLDNIRRLLLQNNDDNRLQIDLQERSTFINYTKTYPNFSIGPGDSYILNVSGGADDRGFGLSPCIGQGFSTYDHGYATVADAGNRAAGWWFPIAGGYVNINGIWGSHSLSDAMNWFEFRMNWAFPMGKTQMKFRRNY